MIEVAGQSNAGRGGFDTLLEPRALVPHVFQFSHGGQDGLGKEVQDDSALWDVEPVQDRRAGQFVATLMGMAMGMRSTRIRLMRTDWYGGQPLGPVFAPGSVNFSNMLHAMKAARRVAQGMNRDVECPWYVWIQGESGPRNRSRYAQLLRAHVEAVRPAIADAIGQSFLPTVVVVQTNSPDRSGPPTTQTALDDKVALAQWDVSRDQPGVILAGPMYHIPMVVSANDNIHSSSAGRMVLGEMLADVIAHGTGWKPLQPRSVKRSGALVDITFDVPSGALAWDTSWVKPVANYGFSYHDDMDSATISQVAIVAKNKVRITLSNVPKGAHPRIGYAQGEADGILDGWSGGRGQLMSPTQRISFFHGLGHPVPSHINHYAIKFVWPL